MDQVRGVGEKGTGARAAHGDPEKSAHTSVTGATKAGCTGLRKATVLSERGHTSMSTEGIGLGSGGEELTNGKVRWRWRRGKRGDQGRAEEKWCEEALCSGFGEWMQGARR
ncbi:hypothetical protein E2562_018845 [Oryza meyeriana var. granulata]|uniref:Uncharacterized protein n=1 Tax=Oryza meyeriana var. granulata TaxID=110450 RepID=A0A6G1F9T2_9ORYZ|nr:hypothetical protein E2562_018845 [Oryza meyeriana var. granulata]